MDSFFVFKSIEQSSLSNSWPILAACCHQAGPLDLRRASSHQMRWIAGGLVANAECTGGHGVKRCNFIGFLCLELLVWNVCSQLETEKRLCFGSWLPLWRPMAGASPDLGAFSLPAMPMFPNHFPASGAQHVIYPGHVAGGKGKCHRKDGNSSLRSTSQKGTNH